MTILLKMQTLLCKGKMSNNKGGMFFVANVQIAAKVPIPVSCYSQLRTRM